MLESYGSAQVRAICKITQRQLQKWIIGGLITPSVFHGEGTGEHHRFSFTDMVAIRTLVAIRDEGISLQTIKKISNRIRAYGGTSFADVFLVYAQGDVVLRHEAEYVSLFQQPGQQVFYWVIHLQPLEQEVVAGIEDYSKKIKAKRLQVQVSA